MKTVKNTKNEAIKVHGDDVLRLVGNVFRGQEGESQFTLDQEFKDTMKAVLTTLEKNNFEVISTYGH